MDKLKFKIAAPERVLLEREADKVTCMTEMGEITVLPGHIPLVSNLVPGELRVWSGGEEELIAVLGGFVEVRPNNEVVILADAAEHVHEIDLARAEEARERARKAMAEQKLDSRSYAEQQAALERALARIRVARKRKYRDVGGSGKNQ